MTHTVTEAGKRLLDVLGGTDDEDYQSPTANMIAAIEAEAVAAERARLREAVEGLAPQYEHHDIVKRAAVLALLEPTEEADRGA